MQRDFWLERWHKNEIGFHLPDVNPRLRQFWPELGLPAGAPVFVPLCGKSLDLHWLAEQGHQVVGVELAEAAVRAFFAEAQRNSRIERGARLPCHCSGDIRIFCGDIMELTALELRDVAAVFDRAALIALPPRMRAHYVDHVLRIIPDGAQVLLVTLEYDQALVSGPPHAVLEDEVQALYGARCTVEKLAVKPVTVIPPAFAAAGVSVAVETVYRMVKQT
jgi:thiopurine S-methyltransferase